MADASSSWNDIPLANSPLNHESELRGTARHSRASVLVQGQPDDVTTIAGCLEIDFLGAASTVNSNATNSYNPRVRQAFATYDRSDWGLHVLVGQAWSLLTLNEHGIEPCGENTPLTIGSGYLPGFTHARQPQARVVTELLDHKLWLGLSLENPQTVFKAIGFPAATGFPSGGNGMALPGGGFVNINNPGGSGFTSSVEYSSNAAPDIV